MIAKYHTHVYDPLRVKHACNHSIGGEHSGLGARWKLTPEQYKAHCARVRDPISNQKRSAALKGKPSKTKGIKGKPRTEQANANTSQGMIRYYLGQKLLSFYEKGSLWNH